MTHESESISVDTGGLHCSLTDSIVVAIVIEGGSSDRGSGDYGGGDYGGGDCGCGSNNLKSS